MKRGLFLKYIVLFVGLVTGVLVINAALDLYFVSRDNRRASIEVQQEKAQSAAKQIEAFIHGIESQIGWVAQAQWASLPVETRRFDYVRLLRQVPAITELVQLDKHGLEQLRVSRLSMDVVGAGTDRSKEPAFVEAMAHKVYYGPVYFRKESEPYLTMAVQHGGKSGVTVAEVNLKLAWDVVSQIKVGKEGYAYVVDRLGRLVAHPDISLVLRGTDMSKLSQVAAALASPSAVQAPSDATNRAGVPVLSAHAPIADLGWLVFVELPTAEAREPVVAYGLRDLVFLAIGLLIAGGVAFLLARRMVVPIRALQEGAERIGGGDLGHRLSIKTGDELEALADQFNRSAAALEESYATLEQRVEDRTAELKETLDQQTATAEVLHVISQSPTDVQPVLNVVASSARRFCGSDYVTIYMRDDDELVIAAREGAGLTTGSRIPIDRRSAAGRAVFDGRTVHLPNVMTLDPAEYGKSQELSRAGGYGAVLAAPMMREGTAIGVITLPKHSINAFTPRQIELLETFAAQAVIAIENVRLFTELRESLEQQTATAGILQVISSSPTDVQPVLNAVVGAALRFSGAEDAVIVLREGEETVVSAHEGTLSTPMGLRRKAGGNSITGRVIFSGKTLHIPDIDQVSRAEFADSISLSQEHGWNAAFAVPMLREGTAIGAIMLRKTERGPFTPRHIEMAETFAAQAVIAIENVRLFTEIQEKSRQLELASQHKSQFLANMSHELRTPLNAIIGYTEMMSDGLYGNVPEKAQGVLERVQSNGKHLLGLINDVLDLSKIEAGQLVLSIEDYVVADMVATVAAATESLARTKGLALTSNVATGLPMGTGDARRLSQVLLNLVGNALKFTDHGGVEIRARRAGEDFELSVIDSGPGIAPEDQKRIFDEFQQVDNTSTRKKGGTGLGLSISRRIVQLHGGHVDVESELGKGSTFTVVIPIHVAQPVKEAAQ